MILGSVVLVTLAMVVPVSQASSPTEATASGQVTPRATNDGVLGSWTPMGITVRTGDDSFQDPGLNQAVYALVKYRGDIYAGGLFDDTGGGGNN